MSILYSLKALIIFSLNLFLVYIPFNLNFIPTSISVPKGSLSRKTSITCPNVGSSNIKTARKSLALLILVQVPATRIG